MIALICQEQMILMCAGVLYVHLASWPSKWRQEIVLEQCMFVCVCVCVCVHAGVCACGCV